jgi:hypothetical protein
MRLLFSTAAVMAALTLSMAAQDDTTKSRTKIKADEGQAVSMTGCLKRDAATGSYTLVGTAVAAGDELKTKTKVETDADDDEATVKATTETTADDASAVGTAGKTATYTLTPRGVDLSAHVGHLVQISALTVKPGHKDADVTIKDKTSVDRDAAPDSTERSKTKLEVPRTAGGQYTVVALKHLSATCAAQ